MKKFNDPAVLIKESCDILGIQLPDTRTRMIVQHLLMLVQWRDRVNLTSVKNPLDIALLHFVDSLTVFKVISMGSGLSVLDIGSGGGFPGMVLKVADPSMRIALMDKDPKKIVFLKYVARELGLTDIVFFQTIVAELAESPRSHTFDVVVSRAFSSDPSVLDSLSAFLQPGGALVRMAGPSDTSPIELPSFQIEQVWEGCLPFSTNFRRVYRYVAHCAPRGV